MSFGTLLLLLLESSGNKPREALALHAGSVKQAFGYRSTTLDDLLYGLQK